MKKIILILALSFCIVSCKKHEIETIPMVTITFDQQMVSSNSMVRSTTNEFLDIIEQQTPDYVNVTLKNLDFNKTYTCKSNESITIPVGNYRIYGEIEGRFVTVYPYEYRNYSYYSTSPIKCSVFSQYVSNNTKHIELNCYYDCYAVFALIDECNTPYCKFSNGDSCPFPKINKYYVAFFTDGDKTINLTPYDDSTEFIYTTYTFSTTYDKDKIYAEYGKYYVIHPQKVDKTTSTFDIVLENMSEGEI